MWDTCLTEREERPGSFQTISSHLQLQHCVHYQIKYKYKINININKYKCKHFDKVVCSAVASEVPIFLTALTYNTDHLIMVLLQSQSLFTSDAHRYTVRERLTVPLLLREESPNTACYVNFEKKRKVTESFNI